MTQAKETGKGRGFVLALLTVAAVRAQEARPPGTTLARWDFEDVRAEVVPDESGNGHDGQARAVEPNRAPQCIEGMVGNGMLFVAAGGTEVVVRDRPSLNPRTGLTITAWIRHSGPIRASAEIVGKKGLAKTIVDGYRLSLTRAGRLVLEIGDGTAVSRVSTGNRAIRPDTWYHVAGTFSPGRGRLYVNGRLLAEAAVPARSIAPSRNDLVIGNFAGRRNAYPFNGIIDEVNLLSAAVDADTIFRLARPDRLQQ